MVQGIVESSILLVVGDDEVRSCFERALSEEGWQVTSTGTGTQARQMDAPQGGFAVAVVDSRLPDDELGFELIRSIEGLGVSIVRPVGNEDTEFRNYGRQKVGVKHYLLSRSNNPSELVTLVEQILGERVVITTPHGDVLEIAPDSRSVRKGGREVRQLTRTEFDLLYTLAKKPDRVFSRRLLLMKVWDEDVYIGEERSVNNHIQRLRAKLGDNSDKPRLIETVREVGYKLRPG